nr:u0002n [Mycobacterium tuberculosis]
MSPAEREFDIVLYGATGFSGKLTAEHLAHSGSTARIALAGRSSERLRGVRMMLGPNAADWPLILADASQPLTLEAMAARAQVVLTTVGPYTRYGLPLVAACAKAGTDYADLTGELMFCRNSIDLYHKQAADTGARIILACGFDSIPSDLNVYQLYRRSVEDGTGELCDTDLRAAFILATLGLRRLGSNVFRSNAHGIQRPRGPSARHRPVHADHGPGRRTRTWCAAGFSSASRT